MAQNEGALSYNCIYESCLLRVWHWARAIQQRSLTIEEKVEIECFSGRIRVGGVSSRRNPNFIRYHMLQLTNPEEWETHRRIGVVNCDRRVGAKVRRVMMGCSE